MGSSLLLMICQKWGLCALMDMGAIERLCEQCFLTSRLVFCCSHVDAPEC